MALTSDTYQQVVEFYFDGEAQVSSKWEDAYEQRTDQTGSIKLGSFSTEGVNRVPGWNGATAVPQARVRDIGSKTVNFAQFALQFRISKLEARFNPTLVPDTVRGVGRAVANTKAILAAAIFNGQHSTTTVVPGSKTLAATDHPTALGGTRSNKLSTGCDLAAIFAAMTLARQWVTYDGGDYDLAEYGWNLFHPVVAGLEQVVAAGLGSAVTSDQQQKNTVGAFGISQIVWSKIANASHWGLVSKAVKTLGFWELLAAEDTIDVDEDSRQIKITVDGAWAAYAKPQPSGFIGGNAG